MARTIKTDGLSDLATEYIKKYLRRNNASPYTIQNYARTLRRIEKNLDTSVAELDIERFLEWLLEEGDYSYNYCKYHFTVLRSLYKWAEQAKKEEKYREKYEGVRIADSGYSKFNPPPRIPRHVLSVEEARELLNMATLRERFTIMLLLKTGIRAVEAVAIQLKDLDIREGYTRIELKSHAKRNKNKGDNCTVFLDEEGTELLKNYLDYYYAPRTKYENGRALLREAPKYYLLCNHRYMGEPLKYAEVIGTRLRRLVRGRPDTKEERKTDFENFHPHACRWTFTNWLRRAGMDYLILKALRGDTGGQGVVDGESIAMVEHYSDIEEEELREEYLSNIPHIGCKRL